MTAPKFLFFLTERKTKGIQKTSTGLFVNYGLTKTLQVWVQ